MEFEIGDEVTIINQNGSLNGVHGEVDEIRFVILENLYFLKNISYRYFTNKELVLRVKH